MININCIHYKNVDRCGHPNRPKFLWFRRVCCEPKNLCCIKEEHPRSVVTSYTKLAKYKRRVGFI